MRLSAPATALATALLAMALAALGSAAARAADATAKPAPEPPPHPVVDPHYGDVLFEFFQGKYFPAITKLEVSQHFERMPHHADEAEVLRGGLLLSYGMHQQAAEVFEQLIARGAAPSVRDRAWYYLAKVRWQRGRAADAAQALGRIEHVLPAPLEEDRLLLQANVLMAIGDNAGAARLLAAPAARKGSTVYARYNLGVALVRGGDLAHGTAILDEIGRQRAPDEEQRALRDKANVALGFAALRDDKPRDARTYLERVRLDGLQSNKALLGFGWAADALHDPKLALVPWLELSGRDPSDASVLEAQLAVPYAFAELGASGQALQRYNVALSNFEHESANIDATIAAIREGRLRAGLMARNPGDRTGWFQSFKDVPLLPHAEHLTPVIAGNEFQESFKNYRDLLGLAANLAQWRDDVRVYADMVAARRQRYAERLPEVSAQARATGIEALEQRTRDDATQVAQAETDRNGAAYADERQRELRERIAHARVTLDRLGAADPGDPAFTEGRERLRRVEGALQWELARAYPARAWGARKNLSETQAALVEAHGRADDLAAAQRTEPQRFEAYAQRLQALSARLDALAPRVTALTEAQGHALDDLAIASLLEQQRALGGYAAQARIAVAQIYDRATEGPPEGKPEGKTEGSNGEGGHAKRP